jgi:hypothetical protein
MPKNEYEEFQDRIFDKIRDMEDAEGNSERKGFRWAIKVGGVYGLSEDETLALRNPGMRYVEWMRAIDAAGKNRR